MSDQSAVTFIHGLSETGEAWRGQLDAFATHWRTIAYDVRGFGRSPVGRGEAFAGQFADDLAQILSAMSVGSTHLVGFSMGGVIAQRFALDYSSWVDRLVLVASSSKVGSSAAQYFDRRISLASSGDRKEFDRVNVEDARRCFHSASDAVREEYVAIRKAAPSSLDGYVNACRAMRRLHQEPLTSELANVSCPTYVLTGNEDQFCPPRAAGMIADAIPGAELLIIPDAGHCVHWEKSAQFNDAVIKFLNAS